MIDAIWTFEHVAARIRLARERLVTMGVHLHSQSSLARIFAQAEEWVTNEGGGTPAQYAFALETMRVCEVVHSAHEHGRTNSLLKFFKQNSLALSNREISRAKDALFELEMCALLEQLGAQWIPEEPDIVVHIEELAYGIACKKVYSRNSFIKQFSKGVKQIKRSGMHGIVAINVDDLLPENPIILAETMNTGQLQLSTFIHDLIEEEHRKMAPALQRGDCDGLMICLTVPARIAEGGPTFRVTTHRTLWSPSSLPENTRRRIYRLRYILESATRASAV
ncbi:hypothetical protein [Acidovorax sp.]|uniref:hypothetical protein n=1 Tax=Acidovorax sp. TaxID=1872122 RepID=UPI003D04931F